MKDWKIRIENLLQKRDNKVAKINLVKKNVHYSEKIKSHRILKILTGDEEIVRAYIIDRLVNNLDYKAQNIETEKEYTVKIGRDTKNPRIDIIVKDNLEWRRNK